MPTRMHVELASDHEDAPATNTKLVYSRTLDLILIFHQPSSLENAAENFGRNGDNPTCSISLPMGRIDPIIQSPTGSNIGVDLKGHRWVSTR